MNGYVDTVGRALLSLEVRSFPASVDDTVDVWIDTGFTGELVLPKGSINSLNLEHSGSVDAILADGSQIELDTYTCFVNWFGQERRLEVIANEGSYPLLGIGLLWGLECKSITTRTS